jgi:hypothetical protein
MYGYRADVKYSKLIGMVDQPLGKNFQKGWYALQAFTLLPHRFDGKSPTKIHEIAIGDGLREKFLEFIPLLVKHARILRLRAQRPFSGLIVGSKCCGRYFGPHPACGSLPLTQVADARRVET